MLGKVLLLIFIQYSLQQSTPSSPTYEAVVVEFNFGLKIDLDPVERTKRNLEDYGNIIGNINSTVDIIVFPEMTLNRMETAVEIPEVADKISPCVDQNYEPTSLLRQLSCGAKVRSSYLVVNMITKSKCPDTEMKENGDPRDCKNRDDGFSYYNTNVVFDRNGTVISRYRKFNLFGEEVDKPFKPYLATFETDFGVTFGHFVCFDLMFRYPAVELIRSKNIKDIVFTTMWFSEAPFLTATQAQQNWAHSHNVNFLAAGANFPAVGSTGTGIYGGNKGAYVMEMAGTNKSSIYRATVLKKIPENEAKEIKHNITKYTKDQMKTLKLKRDQLDAYDMTFLDDSNKEHYAEKNSCKDGFCCSIKVNYTINNMDGKNHYQYVMAFHHGKRTFDGFADGGIVACAILACHNKTIASCGVRDENLENIHIWKNIQINGKFPTKDGQFLYLPTSLDTSVLPLQPEKFEYKVVHGENEDEISIILEEHADDLLAFGIYGRDFNLDGGSSAVPISVLLLVSLSLLSIYKLF